VFYYRLAIFALTASTLLAQTPSGNDAQKPQVNPPAAQASEHSAQPAASQSGEQAATKQTKVRVNYLNVCTPTADDQATLLAALKRVPLDPRFAPDFEASHGLVTMKDAPTAKYVRLRHDMAEGSAFTAAQYSLSADKDNLVETLVLHPKDVKDFLSLTLEATASAAAPATSMVASQTPVNRIKMERFGKSSIVVAKCEQADQTALAPLFDAGSSVLDAYRTGMRIQSSLASELRWISPPRTSKTKTVAKTPPKHAAQKKH